MEKTIFNTNVELKSKSQFLRLKKAIKEAGLKMWSNEPFDIKQNNFHCETTEMSFDSWFLNSKDITVTEAEFLQLLKEYKDGR